MWVNIFVRVVIARTVGVLFAWAVVVARAVVAMAVNFRSLAVNSRGVAGWCCWWCKCCRGQIVAMPRWFVVGVNTAIVVALVVAAAHAAYPPPPTQTTCRNWFLSPRTCRAASLNFSWALRH